MSSVLLLLLMLGFVVMATLSFFASLNTKRMVEELYEAAERLIPNSTEGVEKDAGLEQR